MKTETYRENWASAWLDVLSFSVGLAVAWWAGWTALRWRPKVAPLEKPRA